jgi:hypothetical protein
LREEIAEKMRREKETPIEMAGLSNGVKGVKNIEIGTFFLRN